MGSTGLPGPTGLPASTGLLPAAEARSLAEGCVIPAHPLALTPQRRLDERRQRALTRYYLAAGAGGVAVGVHTTQFAIRGAGLLRPVLELARDTIDETLAATSAAGVQRRPFLRIAGACGELRQAIAEAELAASLGYHAVLLGPAGGPESDEADLLLRAKAVGEVLPIVGFYLQEAVGGQRLSRRFWRELAELPSVVAAKIAPFDRYRTLEAIRGISESDRGSDVALYTGNDDAIVADLLTPLHLNVGQRFVRRQIVGGLLGQWAVWTHSAVRMLDQIHHVIRTHVPGPAGPSGPAASAASGSPAESGDVPAAGDLVALMEQGAQLTDANAAIFDAAGDFAGCIAGVHEILRRQGLLAGTWCLDPDETLSPGQVAEIDRVCVAYPHLTDDAFVREHLDDWLR
ncbi:dihydrodipicolinate synthase family protein [Actinopolymorpha sp. B11F2]|uniref:dihydrodipicolinate synthase family protein n=1 Tax=Actinopolymorpha sp. B11F2 TaxID=3160862 RepID=UPI0032E39D6F